MTMSPGCRVGTRIFRYRRGSSPRRWRRRRPRARSSHPQRCEKRTGLPPGARRVVVDAGPAEGPTIPPQEIVRHAASDQAGSQVARRRATRPARPRRQIVFGIFFDGHVQAATARQIVANWPACRARPSARLPMVERGQGSGANIRRRPCRWTRGATSSPATASTAAPTTRSRGSPRSRHQSEIHRIGLHRSSCIGACRYHDELKGYQKRDGLSRRKEPFALAV